MHKKSLQEKCAICGKMMQMPYDCTGAKVYHYECAEKAVLAHHDADKLAKMAKAKNHVLKECKK